MTVETANADRPAIERDPRQAWLAVLADGDACQLGRSMADLDHHALQVIRQPEIGLVMVRGRMGGIGRRFNLGEMTVTRCAVTDGQVIGHGQIRGRDKARALHVAIADALLQTPAFHAQVMQSVILPLATALAAKREVRARQAAATRVEFFTLERGDA